MALKAVHSRAERLKAIYKILGSIIEEIILLSIIPILKNWNHKSATERSIQSGEKGFRLHQPNILNSNPKVQP